MLLGAIDWHLAFFVLFALATVGFAFGVLFSGNVVRMAVFLVLSLGASSGLFFLAGAEFVGAMQLMIYVGGTVVLLIFGVMLTAQRRFISMRTNSGEWLVALLVGGALFLLLSRAALTVPDWNRAREDRHRIAADDSQSVAQIGAALAGVRVDRLRQPDANLRRGMSGYLLPFVIVSIHLLVVLVGAAYLARPRVVREVGLVPEEAR